MFVIYAHRNAIHDRITSFYEFFTWQINSFSHLSFFCLHLISRINSFHRFAVCSGWRAVVDAWFSSSYYDAHSQFHGLLNVLCYWRGAGWCLHAFISSYFFRLSTRESICATPHDCSHALCVATHTSVSLHIRDFNCRLIHILTYKLCINH